MSRLTTFLRSEWLAVRVQIALGAIFVAAALPKLADPPSFAHMVWNYHLLPDALVNLQAALLPGVELVAGLALILGFWPRAAAALCGLMLVQFLVALTFALVTDNPVICGCFDVKAVDMTDEEKFRAIKIDIVRDLGMLLLAGHVLWHRRRGTVGTALDMPAGEG